MVLPQRIATREEVSRTVAPERADLPSTSFTVPDTPLRMASPLEIGLCVSDLDRSLVFYGDLLGFVVVSRIEMAQYEAIASGFAESGYTVVRLQLPTGERVKLFSPLATPHSTETGYRPLSRIGFAYVTLIITNLIDVLAFLQDANVRVRPPGCFLLRAGVKVALVEDPDGNTIELVEYNDIKAYRPDVNITRR